MTLPPGDPLDLLDWKRRIFELYAEVRRSVDPPAAWDRWRAVRDELFESHPQSPISSRARAGFGGLSYFGYDPDARVLAEVSPSPLESVAIGGSAGESFGCSPAGSVAISALRNSRNPSAVRDGKLSTE